MKRNEFPFPVDEEAAFPNHLVRGLAGKHRAGPLGGKSCCRAASRGDGPIRGWHVTASLSLASLLFNYAYFYIVLRDSGGALKYSASSLLTIGAAHGANKMKDKINNT